jgi:predicted porin
MDTPLKKAQGKVDLFSDLLADVAVLSNGENRIGSLVQYTTPVVDDFQFKLAFQPGNDIAQDSGMTGSGISASVVYSSGGFYGSFAVDDALIVSATDAEIKEQNNQRLTAVYKGGNWQFGLMLDSGDQTIDDLTDDVAAATSEKETGYLLSTQYQFNRYYELNLQYGASDIKPAAAYALGLNHYYGKKTMTYFNHTWQALDPDGENIGTRQWQFGLLQKF